jgi:DNA-binding transcriptional regulator GbsR (MarR family)
MSLTPSMQRFIAHFGALGPRWGIAADTCRAHALLYLAGKPLPLPMAMVAQGEPAPGGRGEIFLCPTGS